MRPVLSISSTSSPLQVEISIIPQWICLHRLNHLRTSCHGCPHYVCRDVIWNSRNQPRLARKLAGPPTSSCIAFAFSNRRLSVNMLAYLQTVYVDKTLGCHNANFFSVLYQNDHFAAVSTAHFFGIAGLFFLIHHIHLPPVWWLHLLLVVAQFSNVAGWLSSFFWWSRWSSSHLFLLIVTMYIWYL